MIMLLSGPDLQSYIKNFKKHLPRGLKVLYIPAFYGKHCQSDFKNFSKAVSVLKWDTLYFPVDKKLSAEDVTNYHGADMVVMDGGNTFFLSHHLKKSGLAKLLKSHPRQFMIGLSAGAIVMTPSIRMAKYPTFSADENIVKIKDLTGLGLVDFELHVHATNNKRELDEVAKAARRVPTRTIQVLADGDYLIVNDPDSENEVDSYRKLQHIKLKN